jgi:hypothetical protein
MPPEGQTSTLTANLDCDLRPFYCDIGHFFVNKGQRKPLKSQILRRRHAARLRLGLGRLCRLVPAARPGPVGRRSGHRGALPDRPCQGRSGGLQPGRRPRRDPRPPQDGQGATRSRRPARHPGDARDHQRKGQAAKAPGRTRRPCPPSPHARCLPVPRQPGRLGRSTRRPPPRHAADRLRRRAAPLGAGRPHRWRRRHRPRTRPDRVHRPRQVLSARRKVG